MLRKPSYPAIPKANQGLKRVSPGMYRNQAGELVNSSGGALPGRRPPQALPSTRPGQGAGLVNQGRPRPATSFDDLNSMLVGESKPGMNLDKYLGDQLSRPSRSAPQGQWSPQMTDLEQAFNAYKPSRPTIQKRPGPGFPSGGPTPEQIAAWTQRAEAIRNGGPVTMDLNPMRDQWVSNYLGQEVGKPPARPGRSPAPGNNMPFSPPQIPGGRPGRGGSREMNDSLYNLFSTLRGDNDMEANLQQALRQILG